MADQNIVWGGNPPSTSQLAALQLAAVMGDRTVRLIDAGRPSFEASRLAGSYAFRGRPDLREPARIIGRISPETPWGES